MFNVMMNQSNLALINFCSKQKFAPSQLDFNFFEILRFKLKNAQDDKNFVLSVPFLNFRLKFNNNER